jgi:hypothetical protein
MEADLRKTIFAAAALLSAAPALAQPPSRPAPPARGPIEANGQRIEHVADALMDVDLGPVLDALSPDGPRGRHATLGTLAERRDPAARARMHEEIAGTSAGLEAALREAALLAPLVRRTIAEAARGIDEAARQARTAAPPQPYSGDDPLR